MNQISPDNLALLEKRYRMTALFVLAQIFITLVLIALAWLVAATGTVDLGATSVSTLWVAVVFLAIGSFMLRRLFTGWERLKNAYLLRGASGLLGTLQMNALLLAVFALLIAVLGFVITIFSGASFDMLRAGAIALIVFLVNFPRKSVWKNILANLEKV